MRSDGSRVALCDQEIRLARVRLDLFREMMEGLRKEMGKKEGVGKEVAGDKKGGVEGKKVGVKVAKKMGGKSKSRSKLKTGGDVSEASPRVLRSTKGKKTFVSL